MPIQPIQNLWKKLSPTKNKIIKSTAVALIFVIGIMTAPTTNDASNNIDEPQETINNNGIEATSPDTPATQLPQEDEKETIAPTVTGGATEGETSKQPQETSPSIVVPPQITETPAVFDYGSIPTYSGNPYYAVNGNTPYFGTSDLPAVSYESYGKRDGLNRCTTVVANVGKDIMPTEERGSIGMVKPTGWQTVKYDIVDGNYLYNRCHLIGYQLTGENANEDNLITGTRYMNVQGMLPFENMVADYVKETGNHVFYRVSPVFVGNELLARGVLMEAYSVEDNGDGVCFNVFCYNVQPGIEIDYSDGDSKLVPVETQPPVTILLDNYSGKYIDDVRSALELLNLKFTIIPEYNDSYANGYVIKTYPSAGSVVTPGSQDEEGTMINIYVSQGKRPIATDPPTTQAPATEAPATQAPVTNPPATEAPAPEPPAGKAYVLNTKSHKYHRPSCSRLPTTYRQDYFGTSEELENSGYEPCGICHPN